MTPHPDFSRFFAVFKSKPTLFTAYKADVFRQAPPRWMSRPYRFTGLGSVKAGARWSVRGLMPTLYASLDPPTLHAEADYKSLRHGWTPDDFPGPQLTVRMSWKLQRVVDLTLATTRQALNVTKRDLLECDWPTEQLNGREALTQAMGRAAFENLAEGLIVPSARRAGGINVVYYPCHLLPGSTAVTQDEANIPFIHGLDE